MAFLVFVFRPQWIYVFVMERHSFCWSRHSVRHHALFLSQSSSRANSFILADTETLHRKIAEMSHRIRQLEDGLAILQASVSTERHPLLRDDLLKIKFGAEALKTQQSKAQDAEEQTKQSIDALGTLTLTDAGEVKYFGRSAGSEVSRAFFVWGSAHSNANNRLLWW